MQDQVGTPGHELFDEKWREFLDEFKAANDGETRGAHARFAERCGLKYQADLTNILTHKHGISLERALLFQDRLGIPAESWRASAAEAGDAAQ